MLNVCWLPAARDDLAAIITYLAERSPSAARSLRQRIERAVLPATGYPYLHRPGRVPGTREVVVHPSYVVVYRITHNALQVVSVLHTRRAYP
ncbi:type II toxin-antitoxin system RelE/ParE family toxin [Pseudomonadota bacterium AL_CKDN230030165-1A_HGKHYDSX7]